MILPIHESKKIEQKRKQKQQQQQRQLIQNANNMFFVPLGQKKDDTRLIITQIIMMQCAHYLTLGIILSLLNLCFSISPTVEQIFSYKAFTIFTKIGRVSLAAWFLNSFIGALTSLLIVQRAAKCLDHTITLYVVHFFICVFYKGFPVYWEWWLIMFISVAITATLGEYVCYRVESREIPLIGGQSPSAPSSSNRAIANNTTTSSSSSTSILVDDDDDDDDGSIRSSQYSEDGNSNNGRREGSKDDADCPV